MGKFAQVKDDFVVNLIVTDESQIEEMSTALNSELVDAAPFNLTIGDLRVNGQWTRNVEGVQTVLSERPTYTELEEAVNYILEG